MNPPAANPLSRRMAAGAVAASLVIGTGSYLAGQSLVRGSQDDPAAVAVTSVTLPTSTTVAPATPVADTTDAAPTHEHDHGAHDLGSSSGNAHGAAMALVAPELATHQAVADGSWTDPATWDGAVPTNGARVIIGEGITVTIDARVTERIETIGVHGTLRFAPDVDTQLLVDTIVSSPTARVEVGTPEAPIADDATAHIRFVDDGPIDRTVDPNQLGRGALLHGTTIMHGAEVTHRTTLAEFARAGDTSVQLQGDLAGWTPGDQIVITGTQGPTSDEVRTIAAVDGATVRFGEPLELDHVAPRSDLSVWVANLTRNIVVDSENPEIARRGHVMFMHTHAVDVHNVLFTRLGRTDKSIELDDVSFGETAEEGGNLHDGSFEKGDATNIRARYSVHFHRGGTDPNSTAARLEGSVVVDDPGWAFVNHSSNVDFVDNVSYRTQGVGFMTEAGDEVGSMVGNIAIRSVMPGFVPDDGGAIDPDTRSATQDFGFQGDGFWLQGNRVSLIDNVAAGSSAHGIIFWSEGLLELSPDPNVATNSTVAVSSLPDPSLVPDRDRLEVWWAPLGEVRNNESYGALVGFRSRYVHAGDYLEDLNPPPQAYIDSLDPVIDGLVIWDVRDGVLLNYNERLSLINADIIGNGERFQHNLFATAAVGVGLDVGNEVTRGPGRIENVRISGFEMGIIAPRNDAWTMRDIELANVTDVLVHTLREAHRDLEMVNVTFGPLDGTAVADHASERRNIVMDPWFVGLEDGDGFLFSQDRITVDGRRVFFDIQAADAVPVTRARLGGDEFEDEFEEEDDLEEEDELGVVGLTNSQLIEQFGASFGGALAPADASQADWLTGGVVG